MGHCRKFSKQQKLFKKMEVRGGALTLSCEDGSVLAPGEGDVVILCTGQRAEGFGPGYHRACATKNRGGIFMPYAFSGTATGVAMYWTHMVVSYLDKKPTSYSRGTFFDQALKVAEHMEGLKDRSPWASFMTFLGTNQLDVCGLVFPWEAVGAGDLASSPKWIDWYGSDLDVRKVCGHMAQKEYEFDVPTDLPTGPTTDMTAESALPTSKAA